MYLVLVFSRTDADKHRAPLLTAVAFRDVAHSAVLPRTCLSEITYPGILNPNGTCESGITTAEKARCVVANARMRLNQSGLNALRWLFNPLAASDSPSSTPAPPKVLSSSFFISFFPHRATQIRKSTPVRGECLLYW